MPNSGPNEAIPKVGDSGPANRIQSSNPKLESEVRIPLLLFCQIKNASGLVSDEGCPSGTWPRILAWLLQSSAFYYATTIQNNKIVTTIMQMVIIDRLRAK